MAHPKKTKGDLGKEDISGIADITNRADNVFSVERMKEDGPFSTSLTVLKNRSFGVQDVKYGLNFDTLKAVLRAGRNGKTFPTVGK